MPSITLPPQFAEPDRLWDEHGPRGRFEFGVAPVKFEQETFPGTGLKLKDNKDATLYRLHAEWRGEDIGGGFAAEWTDVDNGLHENAGATRSEVEKLDVYAFVSRMIGGERVRMPVRIGPYFDQLDFDIDSGAGNLRAEFQTIGLRFELEPEVDLLQLESFALGLFGAAHAGIGYTVVDIGGSDDLDTTNIPVGARVGVRITLLNLMVSAGFYFSNAHFPEGDLEVVDGVNARVIETDVQQSGFLITGGLRW